MCQKKFEANEFLEHLELDEDLAIFESSIRKNNPYRRCPKCGTEFYEKLFTDEKGKVKNCDQCKWFKDN